MPTPGQMTRLVVAKRIALLPPEERQVIKAVLDGMIVKHRTKQLVGELRT